MNKYQILINILDQIIREAPVKYKKKYPQKENESIEKINHSRSRAFIHLFLKVQFGILTFEARERFLTDGSFDGGIDGYFINKNNSTIYFIQSKFRTTEENFLSKQIELKEILVMDIDRILDGETKDEEGNEYNGKIKQLQRDVSETDNIARYSYRVIILANLFNVKQSNLRKLSGGYSSEVFDFKKCYEKLVFPMVSGTFHTASELNINIDLSNKNAGSKISYTVQTRKGECEITVLFVPTIEIGKIMYQYKNSILKYNPRSYLGHEGKKVNSAITETIVDTSTNEFALFNNGITMLSDETFINEKIGQKNKAKLIVKNPQIINGGQTSYTLSRIYESYLDNDVEIVFQDKEVLLKIITLLEDKDEVSKLDLIDEISIATNRQTPVINADKFANDPRQIELQKVLFDRFGILYERKRGEFADGILNGYIDEERIVERNLFFRIWNASNGQIVKARQKRLFIKQEIPFETLIDEVKLRRACFGIHVFSSLRNYVNKNYRYDYETYAKVYAIVELYMPESSLNFEEVAKSASLKILKRWKDFMDNFRDNNKIRSTRKDKKSGLVLSYFSYDYNSWYKGPNFIPDVEKFYNTLEEE